MMQQEAPPSRGSRVAKKYRAAIARNARYAKLKEAARQRCPAEQAKLFLQRKGWVIFKASVLKPRRRGWMVGNKPKPFSKAELIAFAVHLGWTG